MFLNRLCLITSFATVFSVSVTFAKCVSSTTAQLEKDFRKGLGVNLLFLYDKEGILNCSDHTVTHTVTFEDRFAAASVEAGEVKKHELSGPIGEDAEDGVINEYFLENSDSARERMSGNAGKVEPNTYNSIQKETSDTFPDRVDLESGTLISTYGIVYSKILEAQGYIFPRLVERTAGVTDPTVYQSGKPPVSSIPRIKVKLVRSANSTSNRGTILPIIEDYKAESTTISSIAQKQKIRNLRENERNNTLGNVGETELNKNGSAKQEIKDRDPEELKLGSRMPISTYSVVYRKILESQGYTFPTLVDITSAVTEPNVNSNKEYPVSYDSRLKIRPAKITNNTSDTDTVLPVIRASNVVITNTSYIPPKGNREIEKNYGNKTLVNIPIKICLGEEEGITTLTLGVPVVPDYFNLSKLNAYSVDYIYNRKEIFFAGKGAIRSTIRVVASERVDGPVRLTVDWIRDRVYWISDKYQAVEMADGNGDNRIYLFKNVFKITYPNNIVVDPYERFLFFVGNRSVYRTDLEGKNMRLIKAQGLEGRVVKYVALNTQKRRLFLVGKNDSLTGSPFVASINYDGQQAIDYDLGESFWNDIYAIDVFRDTVYFAHYTEQDRDELWSLDLSQPTNVTVPKMIYKPPSSRGGIWGFRVFHPDVQKQPGT